MSKCNKYLNQRTLLKKKLQIIIFNAHKTIFKNLFLILVNLQIIIT